MKKTQFIELIKTVWGTMISYISIVVFVTLGIAIFVGIYSGGSSALKNAERVAEESHLHDLEIYFPYGFSEDDLRELSQVEGVDEIEGSRYAYEFLKHGGNTYHAAVHQVADKVDAFSSVEGTLPQKDGEIAVDAFWAQTNGVALGDELVFTTHYGSEYRMLKSLFDYDGDLDAMVDLSKNDAPAPYLKSTRFKVTALVIAPTYLYATMGASPLNGITINTNLYVAEDAWAEDTDLGYTVLRIRSNSLRGLSVFSDTYRDRLEVLKDALHPTMEKVTQRRCDQLHAQKDLLLAQAREKLLDAEDQLTEAEQTLQDGQQKLKEGKKEVEDAKSGLKDGQKTLEDALKTLRNSEKQAADGKAKLEEARLALAEKETELKTAEEKLNTIVGAVDDLLAISDELRGVVNHVEEMIADEETTALQVLNYLREHKLKSYIERVQADGNALKASYWENQGEFNALFADLEDSIEATRSRLNRLLDADGESITVQEIRDLLYDIIGYKDRLLESRDAFFDYLEDKKAELKDYQAQMEDARKQLAEKEAELRDAEEKIKKGWGDYYAGLDELAEGQEALDQAEKDLLQGEKDLTQGTQEYEDGKKELDQGKADYDKLEHALSGLKDYDATYMAAFDNASLRLLDVARTCATNACYVAALIFVLVSLLVCYSALSRLVNDQAVRIGTKKALGLNQREVTNSFLLYALSAAVIGCLLSLALSQLLAHIIIKVAMKPTFPGKLLVYTDYRTVVVMWVLELTLIFATAYFACRRVLKRRAVTLLAGPKPPDSNRHFYEGWKIWENASLLTKTIVNNCMNDKRRVLGTLVGICSCTTLMIMALTLYVNVMQGFDIQISDYYHFDAFVYFDSDVEQARDQIEARLNEAHYQNMPALTDMVFTSTENSMNIRVIVPEDMERYKDFHTLEPYTKSDLTPYEGTWFSASYINSMGGSVPQTIRFKTMMGDEHDVQADGFYLNYAACGEVSMTPQCYEESYGKAWKPNCFLINTQGGDLKQLASLVEDVDGYLYTYDFLISSKATFEMFESLAYAIAGIALVLAIVMAFLVILNLLNMFVSEKKKELIILRINGYTVKDSKRYMYSDTILLTFLSILLALVLGTWAGNAAIRAIEGPSVYLLKGFNPISCLISVVVTIFLVTLASCIALRQLKRLKLSDINK